jgi:hypothetical protein
VIWDYRVFRVFVGESIYACASEVNVQKREMRDYAIAMVG